MTAPGVKAWSVFGEVSLTGMPRSLAQLQAFDRAGQKAGSMLFGLKGGALLATGAIVGLGGASIYAAAKSVGAFASFDDAMTKSLAIMGNVSEGMRKDMAGAALEVARTTEFSAKQAAESYFFLASAGLSAQQSLEAMPLVAKFAQAGNFDLARATDLLTDAQSALGLTIRDDVVANMQNMLRVSDVLVKANTLANASVEQFSEALTNRAGAALKLVNKDVEEGVAVLAAMADQGIKGAEAGTRLDIVMRDMQSKANQFGNAFREAGVAVYDTTGNMRNMADIIRDLEEATESMSDAQKRAFFGRGGLGFADRSVAATLALLGTSDAIREYERNLRQAGGTTEEVAGKQLESLRAKWNLLKGEAEGLAISIGSKLAPALEGLVDWLRGGAEAARELSEGIEESAISAEDAEPKVKSYWESIAGGLAGLAPGGPIGRRQFAAITDRPGEQPSQRRFGPAALLGGAAGGPGTELERRPLNVALRGMAPGIEGLEQLQTAAQQSSEAVNRIALEDLRVFVEIGERRKEELAQRLREELALVEEGTSEWRELRLELHQVETDIDEQRLSRLKTWQKQWEESKRDVENWAKWRLPREPVVETVKVAVRESEDEMFDAGEMAGRTIIDGIVSGIQGNSDAVERVVKALAQDLIVFGLKKLLGIGSPSRVAFEMGQQFVDGLVLGMESQQPALALATANLGGTMTHQLGARAAGQGGPRFALELDLSKLPPPKNTLEAARDPAWVQLFQETAVVANMRGSRL